MVRFWSYSFRSFFWLLIFLITSESWAQQSVRFEVLGPTSGEVRLADAGLEPLILYQRTPNDVFVARTAQTQKRVLCPVSTLVDAKEDGTEVLLRAGALDSSSSSLHSLYSTGTFYRANPETGAWTLWPAFPNLNGGKSSSVRPSGYCKSGQVWGTILWSVDLAQTSSTEAWTYSGAAYSGPFLQTLPFATQNTGKPLAVNRDGTRLLLSGRGIWTATEGFQPPPTRFSTYPGKAMFSSNERWLVGSGYSSPYNEPDLSMARWDLTEPAPTFPQRLPVHKGMDVFSVVGVFDDGSAVGVLGKEGSYGIVKDQETFLWHASGRSERLLDAIRRQFGEEVLLGIESLAQVTDMSPDGRWIVGKRASLEGEEAWLMVLPAVLDMGLPARPELEVAATLDVSQSYHFAEPPRTQTGAYFEASNTGTSDLIITGATFDEPDGAAFSLKNWLTWGGFVPVTLHPGEKKTIAVVTCDAPTAAILKTNMHLQTNDIRPNVGIVSLERWPMGRPSLAFSTRVIRTQWPQDTLSKSVANRAYDVECTVGNSGGSAAQGVRLIAEGFEGADLQILSPMPFDVPYGSGLVKVFFRLTIREPGSLEGRLRLEAESPARLPVPQTLTSTCIKGSHLQRLGPLVSTPLLDQDEIMDFGIVSVGSALILPLNLKNMGPASIRVVGKFTGTDSGSFRVSTEGSWDNWPVYYPEPLHYGVIESGGIVKDLSRQPSLVFLPKRAGLIEGVYLIDDDESLEQPLRIHVRGVAVNDASPVFVEYPASRLTIGSYLSYLKDPAFQMLFRARGGPDMTARLEREGVTEKTMSPFYSQVDLNLPPGRWRMVISNAQGTAVGSDVYSCTASASISNYVVHMGQGTIFAVNVSGPGLNLQWLKDGVPLADSKRIQGTKATKLTVGAVTKADEGLYECQVTMTAPDRTQTVTLRAGTIRLLAPPQVMPLFSLRPTRALEIHNFSLAFNATPTRFSVTGLPPGLKAEAVREADGYRLTNRISIYGQIALTAASGKPRTYQVTVKGMNEAGWGAAVTVPWIVEPYADAALAGTYRGILERSSDNPTGGRIVVTVSSAGTASLITESLGKQTERGVAYVIGRGPSALPENYSPPLPGGMTDPLPYTGLFFLGNLKTEYPMQLSAALVDGMMVGSYVPQGSTYPSPWLGFRQTLASQTLLLRRQATTFSMALETQPPQGMMWRNASSPFLVPHLRPEIPNYTQAKTKGSALPDPGRRSDASTWVDGSGCLHLMGGRSYSELYDHWMWDPRTRIWTPLKGAPNIPSRLYPPMSSGMVTWATPGGGDAWCFCADLSLWCWRTSSGVWEKLHAGLLNSAAGHYGTVGIPALENRPRSRRNATTWFDLEGQLWLYGGVHTNVQGTQSWMGDLWRYSLNTGMWTWMAGAPTAVDEGADWRSDGVTEPSRSDKNPSWVDKKGRLWLYQTVSYSTQENTWCFDPGLGHWTLAHSKSLSKIMPNSGTTDEPATSNTPGYRRLALTWTGEDGRLWLFGGNNEMVSRFWHFDPEAKQWTCEGNIGAAAQKPPGIDYSFGSSAYSQHLSWAGLSGAHYWMTRDGRFFLLGMAGYSYQDFVTHSGIGGSWQFLEFAVPDLPKAPGYLSLTVQPSGLLSWAGRLPDGVAVTGSGSISLLHSTLLPDLGLNAGDWAAGFYTPMTDRFGSCLGLITLSEADASAAAQLSWNKPITYQNMNDRVFPRGFPMLPMTGNGSRFDPLLLATYLPQGSLKLESTSGSPPIELKMRLEKTNRLILDSTTSALGRLTTALVANTGLITVSSNLTHPIGKPALPLSLQGLIIPHLRTAVGNFTLPEHPILGTVPLQTTKTTEIHVGSWRTELNTVPPPIPASVRAPD